MAYAVDFVLNVMRDLSSSEPVLFQRDGSLYVASAEGFGQVTYGLRTRPEEFPSWEKREQPPEITESQNIIIRWAGDEVHKKPVYMKSEQPYLRAIAFGPDTASFSLKEISEAAGRLAKLPDDGKIRMILHDSAYHSHKYGYGVDGMDVWLHEARVMDSERYLELIRAKEDELIHAMSQLGERSAVERRSIDEAYRKLELPDCVVLTPHMMVSLPRSGRLKLHRDEPDSWTVDTGLAPISSDPRERSILYYNDVSSYKESPFGMKIALNSYGGDDPITALGRMNDEVEAIYSNTPVARGFLERINSVHNELCAPNIDSSRQMERRMKKRRVRAA